MENENNVIQPATTEKKPLGFCRNCGTPYFDAVKFCGSCGTPLRTAPAQSAVQPTPQTVAQAPVAPPPKKKKKKIGLIITLSVIGAVILTILGILLVCSIPTQSEIEGIWGTQYTYDGDEYLIVFELDDDGSYYKIKYKNQMFDSIESGDYEIKGLKVCLYDDSALTYHGISTNYSYFLGTLKNGKHTYNQIDESDLGLYSDFFEDLDDFADYYDSYDDYYDLY